MSALSYKWVFRLITLSLFSGIILTLVSALRICSGSCEEGHNWRLFGMPFEFTGFIFFISVLIIHLFSAKKPHLLFYASLITAGAFGAEIHFVLLQKFVIGSWCPICLSLAGCILIAFIGYSICYFYELTLSINQKNKGEIMNTIWKGISSISILVLGFFISVLGTSKFSPLEAAENSIKESLIFGDKESPIEIYIFTDWACPACRQLEPQLEILTPILMKKARLTFVDHVIHTETLNYSPYNVSFMIKNKDKYLKLRSALTKLSVNTQAPTDEQIEKLAEQLDTKYQQLHFSDIALSQKYFKQLGKQFGVSKTPTLVVLNRETKKGKRLIGSDITEKNVLNAIESLSNSAETESSPKENDEKED